MPFIPAIISAVGAIAGAGAQGAQAAHANREAERKNRMLEQQRLGSAWTGMNPGAEMANTQNVGSAAVGGSILGAKAGSDIGSSFGNAFSKLGETKDFIDKNELDKQNPSWGLGGKSFWGSFGK